MGAYLEVNTQISNIDNLQKNFSMQNQQVQALNKAIDAANDLFKAARADYFEVLMTQRDVLEAKLDLIETKQKTACFRCTNLPKPRWRVEVNFSFV